MRYLTLAELLELHQRIIAQSGGAKGIRDLGLAESALARPQMSIGGDDLYPSLGEKAAALCIPDCAMNFLKLSDYLSA